MPQEVWLEETEQAIECYGVVLVSIMSLAKRPVLFAWSAGLEEAVWQTLGQVLYTRPAYSELPASFSKLILDPEPGDDMLVKTLFAVPSLFDIGPLFACSTLKTGLLGDHLQWTSFVVLSAMRFQQTVTSRST